VMDQLSQLLEDPNAKIVFGITVVGVVAAVAYQVSSSKPGNQVTAVKKIRLDEERVAKEKAKKEEIKRQGIIQQEKEREVAAQKKKESEDAKKAKEKEAKKAAAAAKKAPAKAAGKKAAPAAANKTKQAPIEDGWEEVGAIKAKVKEAKVVASKEAMAKAAAAEKADDGSVKLSLGSHMGAVVGKKGAVIQKIENDTGAKLDINKDDMVVKISGPTEDAVQKASVAVQMIIETEENIKANTQVNTISAGAEKVKAVIGKRGATIQQIQSQSGAKVDANVDEGTLTITGSAEQVAEAKVLINNAMYGEAQETVDLVKQYNVYLIMGEGGSTIRRLQDESNAKFDLPKGSTTLKISGSKEAVAHATQQVKALILENQPFTMSLGSKVGSVVGAGGKNIRAIQDATGVRCEIERDSLNDATLHIIGQPAAVQKARLLVEAALSGEVVLEPGQVKETLDLGSAVSAIIGKGGEKVRELQETHKVKIDIVRGSGTCHVIGDPDKVAEARQVIEEIVQPIIEKNQKAAALLQESAAAGDWGSSEYSSWADANGTEFDSSLAAGADGW